MHYSKDYIESIENKTDFWNRQASKLFWKKFPNTILNSKNKNSYEWFSDGITNMSFLCIDTQIEQGRGHQTAIIYDSPATNTIQKIFYKPLLDEAIEMAENKPLHCLICYRISNNVVLDNKIDLD
jgi:propionyl-CoA synthetase